MKCLAKIHHTAIQPHVDYCITSWGHASNFLVDKVQRLQSHAARIVTGKSDYDVKGIDLVKQLGWHNVREGRDCFTLVTVYKAVNRAASRHIQDLFMYCHDVNLGNTRTAANETLYILR